jgi:hypothetical protein
VTHVVLIEAKTSEVEGAVDQADVARCAELRKLLMIKVVDGEGRRPVTQGGVVVMLMEGLFEVADDMAMRCLRS